MNKLLGFKAQLNLIATVPSLCDFILVIKITFNYQGCKMGITSTIKGWAPSFLMKRKSETTPPENTGASDAVGTLSSSAGPSDARATAQSDKSSKFKIMGLISGRRKKNKTHKPMSFGAAMEVLQQRHAKPVEIPNPQTSGVTNEGGGSGDDFQPSPLDNPVTTTVQGTTSGMDQVTSFPSGLKLIEDKDDTEGDDSDKDGNADFSHLESVSPYIKRPPFEPYLSFTEYSKNTVITEEEVSLPKTEKSALLSPSMDPNTSESASDKSASNLHEPVIDPKSKEIRTSNLKSLSSAFQSVLDTVIEEAVKPRESAPDKELTGKGVVAELKNTLKRLDDLATKHITLVNDLDVMPDLEDKDIISKLSAELGSYIRRNFENKPLAEDIVKTLSDRLGEDIAQTLGKILDKDSSQNLGEQQDKEISAKKSRTSWKRAWIPEGNFKNKTDAEVSTNSVQELGERLSKDIAQKLGKQLGKGAAQAFGKQVGNNIAQKLSEELANEIAQRLNVGLDKDIAQKFGVQLDKDIAQKLEKGEPLNNDTAQKLGKQLANDIAQKLAKQVANDIAVKLGEILDKKISQKLNEQRLGEAVRDCYADAAEICEKYAKKAEAERADDLKVKLAALSALFTELKRHHLAAAATPAFEAFSREEMRRMKHVTPGLVENRSGTTVINTKALSLDVGFGTKKLAKGQVGLEGAKTEVATLDDDGDHNRWDLTESTGKANATLSFLGFLTGKLGGKLKVTTGTNYAETGSYAEQAKVFAKHKNKDAYINKFWKSAGPTAREWKNTYKDAQKYMKRSTGANYKSASAPTHLTEEKIAKGASNTNAINALAAEVSPELRATMAFYYPPLDRPMTYAPMSVPAGGGGMRGKEGTSITIVEGTLEGSLKTEIPGFSEVTNGYLKFAAEGKLAGIGRRREFDIERLKPSHVLLSGAYTKDMRKSLDLWNEIERRSKTDSKLESKLKLYERVKDDIGKVIDDPLRTSPHDQDTSYNTAYFGPVTDIPDAFLNTIRTPENNLEAVVNAVAAQCEQLRKAYETLQQNAGLLHAASPKGASKLVKNQYKVLNNNAFKEINKSAWGRADGTGASDVKLADLVSSSTKRVEFLADSYDAISTALGGAGTYLEIVKAKVAEMENPPLALVKAINQADENYGKANTALALMELPMHEDSLHRYNTIAWGAVSSKNEREVQASLSAGISPDLDEKLQGLLSIVPHLDTDLTLDTTSLGISAGLNYKVFTANHPNLTRGGDFREITLSLRAGGGTLVDGWVEKAAILALTKMRKDLDGVEPTPEEIHALRDSIKTGLSTVALNSTKGLVLSWKHHKFSKAGDDAWRQQYFRIAEQTKDTLAVSRTVPTPVPGLTVTPGVRATQDLKNPLYEMMGNDLSHHVLSLVRLDELFEKAKKKKLDQAISAVTTPLEVSEAGSGTQTRLATLLSHQFSERLLAGESSTSSTGLPSFEFGSPNESAAGSTATNNKSLSGKGLQLLKTPSDSASSEKKPPRIFTQDGARLFNDGDYQLVTEDLVTSQQIDEAEAQVFAAAEANGFSVADEFALLKEEFDADLFRKNQFFSTNAILDVVKDYHDFLDWKNGSPLNKQPNSGFVFYDRAEIQDVAKNARRVDSLAAGKSAFAVVKVEKDGGEIEEVRRPEMRVPLSDPLTDIVSREELTAFEQRMQQDLAERKEYDPEAKITPDDRARLLLTTEEGKKVFSSYKNIVGTYKELTGVITTLLGYEGRLREEMPKFQTAHRLGVVGKRAGAALLSTFDGSGLHPSKEAGTEAANTLSQRGYFSPERLKLYGDLRHDIHSLMQTNTWLVRHGLAKAENDLDGMHSLIVSLLQHATGRYDNLHVEEAGKYLKMFDSNALLSANMDRVISEIKRDHGEMQVHMIAPGDAKDGIPAWIGDLGVSQQGDLGTPQQGARSVVIMRNKIAEGKDTFSAIVHGKRARSSDIPEHLKQLDKAKAVRSVVINDSLPGRDSGLTGVQQREAMKIIGTQQRGRISSLVKNASASLADKTRPERKVLREMDNNKLKGQIKTAAQLEAGSTRYWREGVKEMKKHANNKDVLTPAVVTRPEEKTGKELRKEIKENISPNSEGLSMAQYITSRFKRQSKTAEVMTRLNHAEVKDAAQHAKHPKIKEAAEKELVKRQEMEDTLVEMKKLRTQRQLGFMENWLHNLTQDIKVLKAEISETQKTTSVPVGSESSSVSKTEKNKGLRQMKNLVQSTNLDSQEMQDQLDMFKRGTPDTDGWFAKQKYQVVSNTGDANNCLLIALLQHATGLYEEEHGGKLEELARSIRNELEEKHGLKQKTMLFASPGHTDPVLTDLMGIISEKLKSENLSISDRTQAPIIIVTPFEGGTPYAGGIDNDAHRAMNEDEVSKLKQQKMIVYGRDGKLHFEAVKSLIP